MMIMRMISSSGSIHLSQCEVRKWMKYNYPYKCYYDLEYFRPGPQGFGISKIAYYAKRKD